MSRYGADCSWEQLVGRQNGRCAICHRSEPEIFLVIDHCHKMNCVRGALCRQCNSGIGMFRDDPEILHNAVCYLRKNKKKKTIKIRARRWRTKSGESRTSWLLEIRNGHKRNYQTFQTHEDAHARANDMQEILAN